MDLGTIQKDFKTKVCDKIRIQQAGVDRFYVNTPFTFEDGDHLKIVMKKDGDASWQFTDEGHTFMHVSYEDINVDTKTRQQILERVLSTYKIENMGGELIASVENNNFGDCLYTFIQGLVKVSDITYLKRERVKSAFMEEFHSFIEGAIPKTELAFNYNDPVHDPQALYPIDCRIEAKRRPIFMFAILHDGKCRDATITCLMYEKFGVEFTPVGIFENQEEMGRKVLARFTDVCEKQFSSLQSARERFKKYYATIAE